MFGSIGFPELVLIFVVALLLFGPRKLPEIGRSVGKAMGEFRRASNDLQRTLEEEVALDDVRKVRDEVAAVAASVSAAVAGDPSVVSVPGESAARAPSQIDPAAPPQPSMPVEAEEESPGTAGTQALSVVESTAEVATPDAASLPDDAARVEPR